MKFTVRYNYNDIYEGMKLDYTSRKRKWLIIFFGVLTLLLNKIRVTLDVIFILLGISLIFYKQTVLRLYSYYLFKKSSKKSKILQEPINFEINEKEIIKKNNLETSKTSWSSFTKYLHNKKILALYYSPLLAFTIPKRCIETDEEWDKLINLAEKNIKKG